jgi:hypothetical protein
MKALAVILSVYILVLTAIPCLDLPKNDILQKVELSQNTTDNHQNDGDHCSPFCVCNCCGHPIEYMENTLLSSVFSFTGKQVFWHTPNFKSNPDHSIWQPPKLS